MFSEPYAFVEVSVEAFPAHLATQALAFVRDEAVWSALLPTRDAASERFVLFSFHFTHLAGRSRITRFLVRADKLKEVKATLPFPPCSP